MNLPILSKNVIIKKRNFQTYIAKIIVLILPPQFSGSFRRISLKIFSTSYILKNIVYIKGEVWKLQD